MAGKVAVTQFDQPAPPIGPPIVQPFKLRQWVLPLVDEPAYAGPRRRPDTARHGEASVNRLSAARRAEILLMLCKGASMRGVTRSAGISINTTTKLLIDAGRLFAAFHDHATRGVVADALYCFKNWSHIAAPRDGAGDAAAHRDEVWTWSALDRRTGLVIAYHIGGLAPADATAFTRDVSARLATPFAAIAADAAMTLSATEGAFVLDVRNAVAVFSQPPTAEPSGDSAPAHRGTAGSSSAEGRIMARRFTRLRNAYSKKVENFAHMAAIYTVWYNYVQVPAAGITRAMAAGLADRRWTLEDLIMLGDAATGHIAPAAGAGASGLRRPPGPAEPRRTGVPAS